MTEFTALPARPLAEFARNLQKERSTENYGLSVMQLLQVLCARFEQDEVSIRAHLLHYQDATSQLQVQKSKVQFAVPDESMNAEHEQCKRPPHRVYPVTPERPDPVTLAKLMEVSYTEWSDSTYEDTTGDSKLAQWLASFVDKDLSGSHSASQNLSPLRTVRKASAYDTREGANIENLLNPKTSQPFLLPAFMASSNGTHYFDQSVHRSVSPRRRALSDPPTPSRRQDDQTHNRSSSTSHSTLSLHKKRIDRGLSDTESVGPEDVSAGTFSFPLIKSPAFSPFSMKFRKPSDTTDFSPSLESPPATPPTLDFALSPVQSHCFPTPKTPLRHMVRFDDLEQEPNPPQGTPATDLMDLSGVHAFNLSLQHASKSPFLIRTWKRMLGELAGRFPLSLSDYQQGGRPSAEEDEVADSPRRAVLELSHESNSMDASDLNSASMGVTTVADLAYPTAGLPTFKTHADVLLDREYAGYLRECISARQNEVRYLYELIAQREQTIERMEFVLKTRALEVLGSHGA